MRRFREPAQTDEGVSAVSREANDLAFRGANARSESGGPDIQPAPPPKQKTGMANHPASNPILRLFQQATRGE